MLIHKLRLTAMTLLLLAAVATGAGWLARSLAMKEEPVKDPAAPVARVAPRDVDQPRPTTKPDPAAPARMTVAGRVLDPDGKPVPGAVVDLVDAAPHALGRRQRAISTRSPCWARASPTATAGSGSTRPAPRRPASSRSTRWPPRPGTASAGPS